MYDILPADEFTLYEAPQITTVVPGTNWAQIVPADPTRVVLILSGDGVNVMSVSPVVPNVTAAGGGGLFLPSGSPVLTLSIDQHVALVQSQWYASASTVGRVTAVSISLRRDPALSGYPDLIKQRGGFSPSLGAVQALARPAPRRLPPVPLLPRQLRERLPSILRQE